MKVLVLGAGIVGISTAYWLADNGHEVTVVERREGAGLGTSWGNGAIIHPSSVEPWSAPGVPALVCRSLGDESAPLLLRPSALPKMWAWGAAFLRNCTAARHRVHALSNVRLALDSLEAMRLVREATGVAYHRRPGAVLKIYPTVAQLDGGARAHRPLEAEGLVVERLDREAAVAREPALAVLADRLAGALAFPQDELGDCAAFCAGLAQWLATQGVDFRWSSVARRLALEQGRVVGVETDEGRLVADAVVVALASWSNELLGRSGLRLPVWPVKGVSLTVPRDPWPGAPRIGVLDDVRHVALVPVGGDRLRVAGSAEVTGYDLTPDPARIRAIAAPAAALFPGFAACVADPRAVAWAGLRPVTPSGMPLTGRTRIDGLWVNTGHGHTGWTLGCGSGRRLAAMVAGRLPAPMLA